jgi:hypothetical protein
MWPKSAHSVSLVLHEIFFSVLSEMVFAHIFPVSNKNENEWRTHRVGCARLFFQSSEFGLPPSPHPQASVPVLLLGGYTLPIPTRGQTLWNSRYMYCVSAPYGQADCTVHTAQTEPKGCRQNNLGYHVLKYTGMWTCWLSKNCLGEYLAL